MRERRVPRNISTEPKRPAGEIADKIVSLLCKNLNAAVVAEEARRKEEKAAEKKAAQ